MVNLNSLWFLVVWVKNPLLLENFQFHLKNLIYEIFHWLPIQFFIKKYKLNLLKLI